MMSYRYSHIDTCTYIYLDVPVWIEVEYWYIAIFKVLIIEQDIHVSMKHTSLTATPPPRSSVIQMQLHKQKHDGIIFGFYETAMCGLSV